ncbi:mycothiol system anti-sigma-R factor [Flexivirga oryzae]|uniref:Mycothiol system anti-sigma-R factor n=1 Tax=Flexivirga oryzae TaxID=1794944 RepID=A0A839N380_9MICO|nr:mycothiol system anti-sigma-R factor [Flexivirga oryzae]MBB2890096.1 mycothiol system anti-sigma-R factor [Flexivirga oryzae]
MGAECGDYLSRIYQLLDGELDEAGRAQLQAHLDECPPCLDEYQLDRLLKALVQRSCACEHAPDALRTQILQRITTVRVTQVRIQEG